MSVDKIKQLICETVEKENYILYDCQWVNEGKMRILQVSVMDKDGKMDIDTCANLSAIIGEVLDEKSGLESEYYLEVCSPGAERELRNREEIIAAYEKHEYIYIKLKNPTSGIDDLKGYITSVNDDTINVEYMVKNIKKKMDIPFENISLIRLSVKI